MANCCYGVHIHISDVRQADRGHVPGHILTTTGPNCHMTAMPPFLSVGACVTSPRVADTRRLSLSARAETGRWHGYAPHSFTGHRVRRMRT